MIKSKEKVIHTDSKLKKQHRMKKNSKFYSFPQFLNVDKKWKCCEKCE